MATAIRIGIEEVARIVHAQTVGQVRDLEVEVWPSRIVLRGQAESYYVKQLAQHILRQSLPPDFALENLIAVGSMPRPNIIFGETRPASHHRVFGRPLVVHVEPTPTRQRGPKVSPSFAVA